MNMDERDATAAEPRSVKVTDKRRHASSPDGKPDEETPAAVVEAEVVEDGNAEEAVRDYLDDLRRLQADFDNYRKRMMRDQAAVADRAKANLIGRLLPVIDNFERALSHADADAGVELIFKELRSILETEGLEEIAAQGQPFDPNVHEAVMSNDSGDVDEPTVSEVYRSGYTFKGSIVRPAMVVVARPGEDPSTSDEEA
jgi:molecular chaperone GrpE